MKIINYEQLFGEFKRDGAISKDANQIANMLICELCIQSGKGLAHFLGVKSCFDNHMAMSEPPRDCRRPNFLREYDNENTKLHP
ncbi:hypothetical protein ACTXLJ_11755 [Psychrobacter celer]|uniref:hypothetical protein n=1 Tax=Psychrobacter celer TaxID=306572 RepID=UPI003FD26C9C